MQLGIIGLPNAGKSTLFNALTNLNVAVANYPFTTIDPNIGIINVPDSRLDKLATLISHEKLTPANIEFRDIAGLVKDASKGEGLGNKFLAHIREVDAIIEVVRCFSDNNVPHITDEIDPENDIKIILIELLLADLETIEKKLITVEKMCKAKSKEAEEERELLLKLKSSLENGIPVKNLNFSAEEEFKVKAYNLLTFKPLLYVANTDENQINNLNDSKILKILDVGKRENIEIVIISAKIETEIAGFPKEEQKDMYKSYGIDESGLDKLIKSSVKLLGLITFYTVKEPELKAWTIKNGTKAPQAAGKIHSDMERGFIRAEVIKYDDLIKLGSISAVRDAGLLNVEGKEYQIKDSDIVYFRFAT